MFIGPHFKSAVLFHFRKNGASRDDLGRVAGVSDGIAKVFGVLKIPYGLMDMTQDGGAIAIVGLLFGLVSVAPV
jgi:hypothetical protein